MLADDNFIKSLDYHIVKEYTISFGRNIPIYGCNDPRFELPSALLYHEAIQQFRWTQHKKYTEPQHTVERPECCLMWHVMPVA